MPYIPYEACPIHGTSVPCSLCAQEAAAAVADPAQVPEGGYAIRDKPAGLVEFVLILVLVVIIGIGIAPLLGALIIQTGITTSPVSWLVLCGLSIVAVILAVLSARKRRRPS